jgi:hypothetical protein
VSAASRCAKLLAAFAFAGSSGALAESSAIERATAFCSEVAAAETAEQLDTLATRIETIFIRPDIGLAVRREDAAQRAYASFMRWLPDEIERRWAKAQARQSAIEQAAAVAKVEDRYAAYMGMERAKADTDHFAKLLAGSSAEQAAELGADVVAKRERVIAERAAARAELSTAQQGEGDVFAAREHAAFCIETRRVGLGLAPPTPIGAATMEADGTLILDLIARDGWGGIGEGRLIYPPDHPQYQEVLDHVGGLAPGEVKPVLPWPDPPEPKQ